MKARPSKIILIHGNGGSVESSGGSASQDWFPYAQREFEKLGIATVARDFPDPVYAREKFWLPFLKDDLGADEHTILIGHSSGAIAALRFAEQNQIYGSVLVGSYYTDLDNEQEKKSGYFNRPWQWDKIRANQQWVIMFSSADDPWVIIDEPRYVAQQLKAEYHEYTNRGHFGGDRPNPDFPELIAAVKTRLKIEASPAASAREGSNLI